MSLFSQWHPLVVVVILLLGIGLRLERMERARRRERPSTEPAPSSPPRPRYPPEPVVPPRRRPLRAVSGDRPASLDEHWRRRSTGGRMVVEPKGSSHIDPAVARRQAERYGRLLAGLRRLPDEEVDRAEAAGDGGYAPGLRYGRQRPAETYTWGDGARASVGLLDLVGDVQGLPEMPKDGALSWESLQRDIAEATSGDRLGDSTVAGTAHAMAAYSDAARDEGTTNLDVLADYAAVSGFEPPSGVGGVARLESEIAADQRFDASNRERDR